MISATFSADFSGFNAAIEKADVKLRGLDSNAKNVERTLDRMSDSFSGRKIIQDATLAANAVEKIGGLSKLTEQELGRLNATLTEAMAKYKALGVEAPKAMQDIATATSKLVTDSKAVAAQVGAAVKPVEQLGDASKTAGTASQLFGKAVSFAGAAVGTYFTGRAILSAISNTTEWASHIEDVSQKLGMTAEATQRYDAAARQSGTSIDAIGNAMGILSQKLVEGGTGVVPALDRLGLSLETLRASSPEQAFKTLGVAIGSMSDKTLQLATARELLGRSGTDLIPLFTDLDDAMRNTTVATDEQIKAVDELGDQWDKLVTAGKALIAAGISLAGSTRDGANWFTRFAQTAVDIAAAQVKAQEEMKRTGREFDNLGIKTRELTLKYLDQIAAYRLLANLPALTRPPGAVPVDVRGGKPIGPTGPAFGAPPTEAEIRAITESSDKLKKSLEKAVTDRAKTLKTFDDSLASGEMRLWQETLETNLKHDLEIIASSYSTATQKLQALTMRAGVPGQLSGNIQAGAIPTSLAMFGPGAVTSKGGALGGLGAGSLAPLLGIKDSLKGAFSDLPSIILGAFQGGGDITKSIGSLFGGSLLGGGTGLNKLLSGGLSKALGSTIGGAFSSILPGIGALIGPAISGLTKVFGGLFGGAGKQTNRARDAAIEQATGITGDKGASQARFREMAAAAGVSAKELDKLFSTDNAKAFERQLESITKKIETYGDEQHRITSQAEADAQRLEAAIAKYGFTLEELGPTLQRQKLNEQAQELIEDWNVLISAGLEVGVVNTKMADAINKYLQTALKVGTEVPAAMRPLLQQFADQGLLTDEAGNAITDLEKAGVKFSETMTQGFDRVVKKLDELIDRIYGVGTAIADMPSVPSSIIDPNQYTQGDLGAVPMAAGGSGRVTRPTLFLAGEAGAEDVAFSGGNRRFGGGGGALAAEVARLRADMGWLKATLPIALRDAVLLAR